jgi:drug/metabolite transporter (DMT)-like permease
LISLKDGYQFPPDSMVWVVILFTAIFSSALAFIFQTWAQSHMTPTKAAVILTLETPFAAFFAVLIGNESLSIRIVLGGGLMLLAMYLIVIFEA